MGLSFQTCLFFFQPVRIYPQAEITLIVLRKTHRSCEDLPNLFQMYLYITCPYKPIRQITRIVGRERGGCFAFRVSTDFSFKQNFQNTADDALTNQTNAPPLFFPLGSCHRRHRSYPTSAFVSKTPLRTIVQAHLPSFDRLRPCAPRGL